MIFAVFDVLLAVNMCINYRFFTFIFAVLLLQNIFKLQKAGQVLALDGVYLTKKKEVISFSFKSYKGVPNINSRSRDPDHAPLGVIHHPLCSTLRELFIKEKTVSNFTGSKVTEGSQKLKSRSRDHDHAPLGGHSCSPAQYSPWPIYQRKNEVSSFTRSKVTEGVPKFKKVSHVTLTTPPFDSKMFIFYRISYGHPTC